MSIALVRAFSESLGSRFHVSVSEKGVAVKRGPVIDSQYQLVSSMVVLFLLVTITFPHLPANVWVDKMVETAKGNGRERVAAVGTI